MNIAPATDSRGRARQGEETSMTQRKRNNLNDPQQTPAEIADHQVLVEEARRDQARTGQRNDSQGHTPRLRRPSR